MRPLIAILLLSATSQAASIPTIAGVLSIASSSGSIVRETHDLATHFKRTMKRHGADLKRAVKGKK